MPGIRLGWIVSLLVMATAGLSDDRVRFNEQIRPLLSDRCFACHGPDGKRREADLRLDLPPGSPEHTGPAGVVPGKPEQSPVWERITSSDPETQMPPPSAKKPKFTPAELSLLKRWIEEGAEYEGHWAFLPLSNPVPPAAAGAPQPVDAFVRSRLAMRKLTASPEADRATLLRRVTLDLTGLLPGPADLAEFLEDQRDDAFERAVDRLLASPHYGERWGRHWLDQARYADSNGYAIDAPREMWPYRDWVIQAFNSDQPFDQFTIEQLAGDLLPNPTKSQLVATAFHRNTLINQEGGSDREQFRVEATMDRVNTTGAVWLGLTVGCAQCHTHKFDPISQREYYQLFAFFNAAQDANDRGRVVNVRRGEMFGNAVPVPEAPSAPSREQLDQWRAAWEQSTLARLAPSGTDVPRETLWTPLRWGRAVTASGAGTLGIASDQSILYDRRGGENEKYILQGTTELARIAALRLRVLTHDDLPKSGPGTASNGNFVLSELTVRQGNSLVPLARATADHEQPDYPIAAAIDKNPQTGWAINIAPGSTARMNANHDATIVFAKPIPGADGLAIELSHDVNKNYLVGRFAIDVTEALTDVNPADQVLIAALRKPKGQRTADEQSRLQAAFEKDEPRARPVKQEPDPHTVALMIMGDIPQPRETFVFVRGDFTRPDRTTGVVQPGVLAAVTPAVPAAANANRLDLARWLVDPRNPLTARVTVNRVWMRYFGRGLVETEEDFGTQGTPPTHPELLDYLCREFQRSGWSNKSIHRKIVCSATYRQSSRFRRDLQEQDPRNLLLGRQERLRMEAELTRDAALSASGLLEPTLGGPSVYPPQPEGVYAFTQVNKSWPTDSGAQRFRRTLYTFFYRSAPYPLLTTFDSPDFQAACTRRLRSNTPLQALTLANDVVFLELAQGLALRLVADVPARDGESMEELMRRRVEYAVQLCFSRGPTPAETRILEGLVTASQRDYAAVPETAAKLTTPALHRQVADSEAAALVLLSRTLLNSDNFITRE